MTAQPRRRFTAALVELAAGDEASAKATAVSLAADVVPSRRAMARLIEGEMLRIHGKPRDAMLAAQGALKLADTPYAHFLLARAALDASRFMEAYTELKTCIARRGAAANGTDDVTSIRDVPPFTYFLAKVQDGLGSPEAVASYKAFLAMMHDPDPADPWVADARRHAP